MPNYCTILNTCPDRKTGERIAKMLVERRVAACINLVDHITSIYRWQDGIEQESETLLIIKTEKSHYPQVEQLIQQHHPYEVPEVISLDIQQGAKNYLSWVTETTNITKE